MFAQIIVILALLLIVVGLTMVLLDAFSESMIWGVLVLLGAPVFGPIYSLMHWRKSRARNGFSIALVGLVLLAIGLYGGGAKGIAYLDDQEIVQNLPSALPEDEPLPNEEAAANVKLEDEEGEYDPILSTDKDQFSVDEIEPLAPEEDKTIKNNVRAKVRKVQLAVSEVDESIGDKVEVQFVDGSKKVGKLIASAEDSISLEEQVAGGLVSFEHKLDKIQSIFLLVDPSAAPTPPPVAKKVETPEEEESVLDPIATQVEDKIEAGETVLEGAAEQLEQSIESQVVPESAVELPEAESAIDVINVEDGLEAAPVQEKSN